MVTYDDACSRCGKPLDHKRSAWLELNCRTGLYSTDAVPPLDSQGGFEFGEACAAAIVRNGGKMVRIGRARTLNGE